MKFFGPPRPERVLLRRNTLYTQCGVQIVQHRQQNRWSGFSVSCAHYAESMVLLDLSSARRKQREDPVTAKELAALR